ncbi:MAG: hypothetical protein IIB42_07905 [Candidatus Marinimicrobia bacterium]|nr:hypothetical protein [Candidatus Neomarinimicrobiota bacterium]
MSDLAVSYLQIRDTSSIQYEYLITGKAMIIAKTELVDLQTMPEEMDVRSVADIYDGSSGTDSYRMVVDKLTSTRIEAYLQLLNNCFYFNGEHSTDRAVDFITGLQVT